MNIIATVKRVASRVRPSQAPVVGESLPMSVEDQLDIMIHTTQINERHESCGYCGTSQDPNEICGSCWLLLEED